jgi:prepilin-type N-terminal cleavage/methylation domain-containing protein
MEQKAPMISAIGNRKQATAPKSAAGFSLIEILLVLALIAIASTVVIVNFAAFADRGSSLNAVDNLNQAVRTARLLAVQEHQEMSLRFDREGGQLLIELGNNTIETIVLADAFKTNGGSEIRFYLIPSSAGLLKTADATDARQETPRVRFAPDGTSTPFVAAIDTGAGAEERFSYDPFSNLRMEVE